MRILMPHIFFMRNYLYLYLLLIYLFVSCFFISQKIFYFHVNCVYLLSSYVEKHSRQYVIITKTKHCIISKGKENQQQKLSSPRNIIQSNILNHMPYNHEPQGCTYYTVLSFKLDIKYDPIFSGLETLQDSSNFFRSDPLSSPSQTHHIRTSHFNIINFCSDTFQSQEETCIKSELSVIYFFLHDLQTLVSESCPGCYVDQQTKLENI